MSESTMENPTRKPWRRPDPDPAVPSLPCVKTHTEPEVVWLLGISRGHAPEEKIPRRARSTPRPPTSAYSSLVAATNDRM